MKKKEKKIDRFHSCSNVHACSYSFSTYYCVRTNKIKIITINK